MSILTLSRWVRKQENPTSRLLYKTVKSARKWQMPLIPTLHGTLYKLHTLTANLFAEGMSKLYWAPLFRSRLLGTHKRLHIAGTGMPLITGPVCIEVGDDCRLSSAITISGRGTSHPEPFLKVGNNVGIGWLTTIAVGTRIILEDNVRIAGRSFFAGYPGHPMDADKRALGFPDTEDQIGDIHLEKDVWLGTGVTVCKGVTIATGTIVAADSVVTRSLPANVLAAGNPAKIIRNLNASIPKNSNSCSKKERSHDT